MGEWQLVDEVTEFMTYCCAERKDGEETGVGKLEAINFYHERWAGTVPAAAAFEDGGDGAGNQEGTCEGREPDAGKEAAGVGDDQSDEGEHR